jgi:hypothetical protein
MAGSISFAPSSVPQVSGLLKDRALIKGQTQQSSSNNSSTSRLLSKKMSSTTGVHHKMGDQPVNPISRKSSVFTIENLLAPSIKSPVSPPVVSNNRTSSSSNNTSPSGTSPAAFNTSGDMVQQQFQHYHHQQQNLFSVVGHHPHQHIMPLSLSDPAAYGYAYLGKNYNVCQNIWSFYLIIRDNLSLILLESFRVLVNTFEFFGNFEIGKMSRNSR